MDARKGFLGATALAVHRGRSPHEGAGAIIHVHPHKFSDRSALGAHFPADLHNDARAWELCLGRRGLGRVLFWKVAPLATW